MSSTHLSASFSFYLLLVLTACTVHIKQGSKIGCQNKEVNLSCKHNDKTFRARLNVINVNSKYLQVHLFPLSS